MATFRAFQVTEKNGRFKEAKLPLVDPPTGHVRIKVLACGVCHSDSFTVFGVYGDHFPRCPGHEVAGVVDVVGEDVALVKPGDRVGVGWFGKVCHKCPPCVKGDFMSCHNFLVTGIHFDGGYAEYVTVPQESCAKIPDGMTFVDAAPLMCAGITMFKGIRNSGARAGDVIGIQGLGGLGHLGVQYAARMGFHVVAFSRGEDKRKLATELGAHTYIDTNKPDFVKEVQALGGCKTIVTTATNTEAMGTLIGCLSEHGNLVVAGAAAGAIPVAPFAIIGKQLSVSGTASGTPTEAAAAMSMAALTGVRSYNEVYPIDQVGEAYDRMMSGKAHFRVVLDWALGK